MNAQKKTDKTGATTQPGAAKGSRDAASCCILCRKVIQDRARLRTITSGQRQLPVHAACLDHLHSLLHQAFDTALPTPTLTRALTLGEFLLTKRPRTDAETLACVAYYEQAKTNQPVELSEALLDEQLRYTGFKVRNLQAAIKHAVNQLAYLEACSASGIEFHRLTPKGAHLVEHLPAIVE